MVNFGFVSFALISMQAFLQVVSNNFVILGWFPDNILGDIRMLHSKLVKIKAKRVGILKILPTQEIGEDTFVLLLSPRSL